MPRPVDPQGRSRQERGQEGCPLPKIPGTVINRPNGTFLSLEVAGGNFKLTFYDKKHKPMAKDVTRASARWPNTRSATVQWNRTMLNGSATTLVGASPSFRPSPSVSISHSLQGDGDAAKVVEEYDAGLPRI